MVQPQGTVALRLGQRLGFRKQEVDPERQKRAAAFLGEECHEGLATVREAAELSSPLFRSEVFEHRGALEATFGIAKAVQLGGPRAEIFDVSAKARGAKPD